MFKTIELNKTSLWKTATLSRSYPLLCPASLPILQSHQLHLLQICCTFVDCATTHSLPQRLTGSQKLWHTGSRKLWHKTWSLLELRKFRFFSKDRCWLLLPRKPSILYLLLKCNKLYNKGCSNSHVYCNTSMCHQDFSTTPQWRMAKKTFWRPESQSSWCWNQTFCTQATSLNSI